MGRSPRRLGVCCCLFNQKPVLTVLSGKQQSLGHVCFPCSAEKQSSSWITTQTPTKAHTMECWLFTRAQCSPGQKQGGFPMTAAMLRASSSLRVGFLREGWLTWITDSSGSWASCKLTRTETPRERETFTWRANSRLRLCAGYQEGPNYKPRGRLRN